jgi:hypothetical protein
MSGLTSRFSLRWRQWREAVSLRRAMRIWLATGTVPVAHMVADLDWTTEYPAS